MDETDPDIIFDERGYCNHCIKYFEDAIKAIQPYFLLEQKVHEIKEEMRKKRYDCVLGLSGGLDSSYTAYIAHSFHLRVLIVHFDNGWNAPEGDHNVKAVIDNTGWDLEYHTMDEEEFRDLQLAYLKSGVVNLESISDQAIRATVYKVADEKGIRYLLSGNNWVTEGILPQSWGYRHSDLVNIKDIHRNFGTMKLITYPMMGPIKWRIYYIRYRGFKEVLPLNYIEYNWKKAKKVLAHEWDWKDYGWKHGESIITRFYQHYILPTRWGFDKRIAHLSTLICAGQITRDEALELIQEPVYDPELLARDKQFVLHKLRISEDEFIKFMNVPKTRNEDFRTDDSIISILIMGTRARDSLKNLWKARKNIM